MKINPKLNSTNKALSIIMIMVMLLTVACERSIPVDVSEVTTTPSTTEATTDTTVSELPTETADTDPPTVNADPNPPVPDGEDTSWALWLINAKNPLPHDYVPSLTSIGSHNGDNRELDSRAAPFALSMISAAEGDGVALHVVSSYRRITTQETNFRSWFDGLVSLGHSRKRAFDLTAKEIAIPGTSEHNAGLAIDFNMINESFDQTDAFKWLNDNAHKHGFIQRYPKGTTDITGIIYEPWHWRFVGIPAAEEIKESGLTLEEFIGDCKNDDTVVASWKNQLGVN
jgi:D-alanyl-D-alanine carboxypeptidase